MIYELYTPPFIRKKPRKKIRRVERSVAASDRYVQRILAGSGSRNFKNWLNSRPMDAYVVKPSP
jgi:hypothetical protein